MKKASLIFQLVLINMVFLVNFICLYNNFLFYKLSPFGVIYMAAILFTIFAESASTVLWIFVSLIAFVILLNVTAIVSYKKNWRNFILIGVLVVDAIYSLLIGNQVSMISDLMMLALMTVFSRKNKIY